MQPVALSQGETAVVNSRLHWMFFWPMGWRALLVCAIYVALYGQAPGLFVWGPFKLFSAVVVLGLLGLMLLKIIDFANAEFVLTNKRLIFRQGWWQRTTLDVLLARIESVQVVQSLLGRWLGYGALVVHGTGGSHDPICFLPKPLIFRNQVQSEIETTIRKV